MTSRGALWVLIVVSTALRLIWASSLGVGYDEAYHYLFSVHLDWSYFDHPPMVAAIESIGLALGGGTVSPLTLRLGFIGLFGGSTWLMARLTSRFYGPWAGFIAALLLNTTAYFGAAASVFALPDGPLLFFWLLTLDRLAAALTSPDRLRPWIGVGLAWGGALLSKYHAILLPFGAFGFLVLEPSARPWLRRAGPYLALAIGLAVFSPVLGWNAAHHWVSFGFQGGRAVEEGLRFRPDALLGAVLGQAAYLLPWIWVFLVVTLVRKTRELFHGTSEADRFLLCQAIPPLALFLLVACFRPLLPHWSLVGMLPVFPMLAGDWASRWVAEGPRIRRRLAIFTVLPLILATLVVVQTRTGVLQKGGQGTLGLLEVSRDPTLDTYGWDQVAAELQRRGLLDQPGTFLFTSRWYHSGQLAFALQGREPVLCYSPKGSHGFAQWSRPEQWVGRDGILVVVNPSTVEPQVYERWFERIEPLGRFDVQRAGAAVRQVWLYRCVRQTRPFPFDGQDDVPPDEIRRIAETTNPPPQKGRRR